MQVAPILLITRPALDGKRVAAAVSADCAVPFETILSPVMTIVEVPVSVETRPAGLVLTSANGAARAATLPELRGLRAWCVGDHTADVARQAGFDAVSGGKDADALVALILARRPSGPLLHLHGAHVRGDVAGHLTANGVTCLAMTAYRQEAQPLNDAALSALNNAVPVVLPLYSPRSGKIVAQQGPFSAPVHIVAISAAASQTGQLLHPTTLQQAASPDSLAMIREIVKLLNKLQLSPSA